MRKILFLSLAAIGLMSCEKEEGLIEPYFVSEQVGIVDMQDEPLLKYQKELYFDLSTNTLKAENLRDAWDLALGADRSNPNIFVNPAMLQAVAATGSTDFNTSFSASDFDFEYEHPKFYYHKGRLQDAITNGEVYLIDLGKDMANKDRDYKKLQVSAYADGVYSLKIADLDNENLTEVQLQTDDTYNYQFISFTEADNLLSLEPPKEEWDLHFCKYMERLWDGADTLDYSVTGCLINPYLVGGYIDDSVAKDSSLTYYDLTLEHFDESKLTAQQNLIGHDYKYYDLDLGYSIRQDLNYFIKDTEAKVYRMHFTSFKDGVSTFEFLAL